MTTVRLLLAGFLAACGLVALTPATSHACYCVTGPPSESIKLADAVFVGTLTDTEPRSAVAQYVDLNLHTFEVTRVLDGEVDAGVVVRSSMNSASCGWEGMQVGEEYVVFANARHGRWWGYLCGGTRPASSAYVERVEQVTGPGRPLAPDLSALAVAILGMFGFLS